MAGLNRHRFERKRLNEVFAWGRSIATRRRGVLAWPIAAPRGRIELAGAGEIARWLSVLSPPGRAK